MRERSNASYYTLTLNSKIIENKKIGKWNK